MHIIELVHHSAEELVRRLRQVPLLHQPDLLIYDQALISQVSDAGRKSEAKKMHQCEYMVGETGRVSIVFLDSQVRLMV